MSKQKLKKFDCWTCQYKGHVGGSAHICCNHPSLHLDEVKKKVPMLELMSILGSVGRMPQVSFSSKELNIQGDTHGIKHGWFNFPFNFDPTWLRNCDGCKKKGGSKTE